MNTKAICQDIEAATIKRWGSTAACESYEQLRTAADEYRQLQATLKELKTEKQLCAKQFKQHKNEAEKFQQLKQQMSLISEKMTATNTQIKQQESLITSAFETPSPEPAALPTRFQYDAAPAESGKHCAAISAIIAVDDSQANNWDDYANKHPHSSLYHQYRWRQIISDSFAHQCIYLAAINEQDQFIGILPITRLKSRLFGDFAVSMPYFNYGGVIADNSEIALGLLEHAAQWCQQEAVEHLEIRSTQVIGDWAARAEKVSMIRPLPKTAAKLDEELGTKLRAQIKRARRENTQVRIGGAELIDDFYKVFAINMRDLGTPVYDKQFFQHILTDCKDIASIVVVYLNQEAVSTAFLLASKDMMEIPWASTLHKANPMSINMLLYREVLGLAIERGYDYFDFGRSSADSSTYKFKKQWGAKPVQHHWQYWLANNAPLPELNPNNPKFKLLIAIWQKLPVWLSKLIGPAVVKNLP